MSKTQKKGDKSAKQEGGFMEDKSRWNYSLSPGWSKEEIQILKQALQVYGVGKWRQIEAAKVLPSKNIQQMYLQTQRVIGQQSIAEFMGLHLNIDAIAKKNAANLTGKRKMGFLINEEDMLTKEEKLKRQANNKEKYGLTKEEVKEIKKQLPPPSEVEIFSLDKILNSKKAMSTIEKIVHLQKLEDALRAKLEKVLQAEVKSGQTHQTPFSKPTPQQPVFQNYMTDKNSSIEEQVIVEVKVKMNQYIEALSPLNYAVLQPQPKPTEVDEEMKGPDTDEEVKSPAVVKRRRLKKTNQE